MHGIIGMGNEFGFRHELQPGTEIACHDFAAWGHISSINWPEQPMRRVVLTSPLPS